MAEKKVLTNPDLLNIILDFVGIKIKKSCNVCDKPIKYQIFNQQIKCSYKKYINLETCEKKYFCSEECLSIYKKNFSNKRFCLILNIIFATSTIFLLIIVFS